MSGPGHSHSRYGRLQGVTRKWWVVSTTNQAYSRSISLREEGGGGGGVLDNKPLVPRVLVLHLRHSQSQAFLAGAKLLEL